MLPSFGSLHLANTVSKAIDIVAAHHYGVHSTVTPHIYTSLARNDGTMSDPRLFTVMEQNEPFLGPGLIGFHHIKSPWASAAESTPFVRHLGSALTNTNMPRGRAGIGDSREAFFSR